MTKLTESKLQEALALCSKASAAPWTWEPVDANDNLIESDGYGVCYVCEHGNVGTSLRTGENFSHADARFIAASRTLLPQTLVEVQALRTQLKRFVDAAKQQRHALEVGGWGHSVLCNFPHSEGCGEGHCNCGVSDVQKALELWEDETK